MSGLEAFDLLFVCMAFLFQAVLIVHFALRKWRFDLAMRYGPLVYGLGMPAALLSAWFLLGGQPWSNWLAGLLYLAWGVYGYQVEYVHRIEWRNPPRWRVLVPYLLLYLATVMFYWFPLALVWKPGWYIYAALFLVSTLLNITSHRRPEGKPE